MLISSGNLRICKHLHTKVLLLGLVAVFVCSLLALPLRAQNYLGQTGAPTFTTALPVELGFLNAANGNLHLTVPLGSFPQRGRAQYVAGLVYDSSIWLNTGASWQPTNVANSWGGWRLLTSADPGSTSFFGISHLCDTPPPYHSFTTYGGFNWTSADGTHHYFPGIRTERDPLICDLGDTPSGDAYATDSSGYHMYVTNYYTVSAIYAPNGTQVYPNVKDTSGNYFSTDSNGNVIDTLGRTPISKTTNLNTVTYAVLNSQGQTSNYVVTTTSINVSTAFQKTGVTEYSGSLTVIQKITLPDNTFYQFGYDSYGELNSITLPTGGQITYGYSNFTDAFNNIGRWATSRVSGGGTWGYTPSVVQSCVSESPSCQQQVTVTAPSGDNSVYSFVLDNGGWNSQIQSYSGAVSPSNLLATSTAGWNFSNPCQGSSCTGNQNVQVLTQTLTLPVPGGTSISQTKQYTYASIINRNLTKIQEWKFYTGSLPSVPDRETDHTYLPMGYNLDDRVLSTTVKDGGGNVVAQTNYSYDDTGTLFNSTPATGIQNHDDTNYSTSATIRGNLTKVQRCTVLTACSSNYIQTSLTYDTTGQVLSSQDPNGNLTSFSYTDNFFKDVGGDGPSNPPQAYSPSAPTNAYVKSVTPPLIPASTFGYYYHTGQRASSTDANGNTSYAHFFDSSFSRPTSVVLPDGGWNYATYASSETLADVYTGITAAFSTSAGAGIRQDEGALDNLGRVITKKLISDPEGTTTVTTNYDTTGRVLNVSHPARSTASSTDGVETPAYDGLGRVIKVTHQDTTFSQTYYGAAVSGSGVNATQLCTPTAAYGLGYPALYVDEAGKKREIWTDGFGKTIEADEPDSTGSLTSNTCYTYDSLGNLLQIAHGGLARTTYAYTPTLSRVASVTIFERADSTGIHCQVRYTYDNNGNVLTQLAPAPNQTSCTTTVTITYYYDALNRLTKKTYSDGSATVQYGYDGTALTGCTTSPPSLTITNPKGRRTSMCDSSGAASWSYDSRGRILAEARTILGVTKNISYSYNKDGSISTVTYPSNNVVTYTVSNAQRLSAAKDIANNIQFATAASYVPPGGLSGVTTGQISGGFSGVTESHTYNNSLEYTSTQATSTTGTALNLTLNYNLTGGDNGTVTSITNNVDNGRTQTLTYDPLNRILSAKSSATSGVDCWGQNFGPDGQAADDSVANLTKINSGTQAPPPCPFGLLNATVDANNHINTDSTYAYDAAGNMTKDGTGTGYSYSFDDENRLMIATGFGGGPYCYVYDGNSFRVAKKSNSDSTCTTGTVTKLYWRSIVGDALAETDSSGSTTNAAYNEYVLFGRRRIASRNGSGGIFYYFADQLGSTRTITTGSGTGQTPGQLCYDADFTPYGQEISHTEWLQTTACPPNYKFTSYERDTETGLDYAFARYYSSRLGRFLSTDPLGGSIGDLQSHNAYAYVANNPCNFVDPLGLATCTFNISIDNKAGLSIEDLVTAAIETAAIFGQTDDGKGNWVNLNFSVGGSGDYTVKFTNAGWLYPTAVVGHTGCLPVIGCSSTASVYVDHVQSFFHHPPDPGFLGATAAHELTTHSIFGKLFDDCSDPNSVQCSTNSNGEPPSTTNNSLTQKDIAALFKKCQELHPAGAGGGAVSSIFGSGWGFWSPGPTSEGGWAVGAWVWFPVPTRGQMIRY